MKLSAGKGGKLVFLLRLSPAFPFSLMNYALGLTAVRFRDYVLASATGMAPGGRCPVPQGNSRLSLKKVWKKRRARGVRRLRRCWSAAFRRASAVVG